MTPSGEWFRAVASRVFDARVMERVIDPFLADLQKEYADARGSAWRRRWVSVAGCFTFLKLIVVCGCAESTHVVRRTTTEDRRLLSRAVVVSVIVAVAFVLLMVRGQAWQTVSAWSAILLMPSALPVAIPLGVIVGISCVLGGRAISRQLVARTILLAVIASILSFLVAAWIAPRANREIPR